MLVPDLVLAADINFPVACYQGDELAKLREWEKTYAGKKISAANVDEVKEYLPESFYNLMKDTNRWGEWWFVIVPYQEVPYSPGYIKATKDYYGQPKLMPVTKSRTGLPESPSRILKTTLCKWPTTSGAETLAMAYKGHDMGFIVDGKLKYDMSIEDAE